MLDYKMWLHFHVQRVRLLFRERDAVRGRRHDQLRLQESHLLRRPVRGAAERLQRDVRSSGASGTSLTPTLCPPGTRRWATPGQWRRSSSPARTSPPAPCHSSQCKLHGSDKVAEKLKFLMSWYIRLWISFNCPNNPKTYKIVQKDHKAPKFCK